MRTALLLVCAFALVGCARSDPASSPAATEANAAEAVDDDPTASAGPVLVELFTSQGCSSCPPADAVLSAIGDGEFGDDVIPLAFHVDYWDYIGWRDPFSRSKWSALQRTYGKKIADGRVYTPMLVIDGTAHVVGSGAGRAKRAIAKARRNRGAQVLQITTTLRDGEATAKIQWKSRGDAQVWVAVTESGLRTDIARGENAGRELVNDHVVRELVQVKTAPGSEAGRATIPIDSGWDTEKLNFVAFMRDPRSLAVLAAARPIR